MKRTVTRMASFLFFVLISFPCPTFPADKTFIKEYSYQASEDDSRNSSRVIALREVKRLLLEELGTYLESQTEVRNFQLTKDQITTLTAGIVQTEIVAEKWDGRVYWLKSKITADPDKVAQSIDAMRKDREKTRELESMKRKADELMSEVERLRKAMAAKDGSTKASKAAYDKSIRELSAAEWIEKGHAVSGPDDHFKGAYDAYSRAIELDPVNIKAYYFRARISEKNQAMSDYYKILSIEAKDSEGHLIRAWTYKELNQRDPALQEFGKAIETAKTNKEKALAYCDRGRYYTLLRPRPYATKPDGNRLPNALELSIEDFSNAIKLDPTDPSYFHNRAASYGGLERYDLGIADFTAGIRLAPKNAGLYSGRGQFYQILERHDLAVADLSRAIELEGPDDPFATLDYSHRAESYEILGKFDLAIRDWNVLHAKNPKAPGNLTNIAGLYRKLGKYDRSLAYYDKAAALKLKDYEARTVYYGRAQTYAAKGEVKKAIDDLRTLIQYDPGYKLSARKEKAFDPIRNHPDFVKLVGGN